MNMKEEWEMGKDITRFQENRRRFLLFSEPLIRESNREKIVQFDKTEDCHSYKCFARFMRKIFFKFFDTENHAIIWILNAWDVIFSDN